MVYIKVKHLPISKLITSGDLFGVNCKMTFYSCDFKIISQILVLAGIFTPIDVFFADSIDREISEDISWIEEDLLEYPQLTFEFQFKVSFPLRSCCPILDISSYDRVKHTEDKCFHESVGAEKKWFRGIYKLKPMDRDEKTDILCKEDAEKYECILNYKALCFEPKKIRYIIGYECSDLPNSVQGLKYTFDFRMVSNKTDCQPIDVSLLSVPCNNHYLWTVSPNLFGHRTQNEAAETLDIVTLIVDSLKDPTIEPCYQYINIFLCAMFFSPCMTWDLNRFKVPSVADNKAGNTSVVTVDALFSICREMCEEFVRGCSVFLAPIVAVTDCGYFPSFNESRTCVWEKVTCPSPPPAIENADVIKRNDMGNYTLDSQVQYQCQHGYSLKESAATCKPSGYWSESPDCVSDLPTTVIVSVLSSVVVIVIIIVVVVLRIRRRRDRDKEDIQAYSKRNRLYDGFVSYFSEGSNSDRLFVRQVLQPRLEEQTSPPFRLLFHERDFRADKLIYANILDAIDKSNCVIVIMSQEYVNSAWCREEFEEFMEEQKKDPAYKLFVIMMQEHKTLQRCSIYMKKYFRSKTYYDKNDPDLWSKIERELYELQGSSNTIEASV